MDCAQCGSRMDADARFCPSCGTAVAVTATSGAVNESVVPPPPSFQPPPPSALSSSAMVQRFPPAYGYAQPARTNGLAVASLVLGILFLCGIGSILALVFGYLAKRQIDDSRGMEGGRGMAVAGIVLGWIGVALGILYLVAFAVAAGNS